MKGLQTLHLTNLHLSGHWDLASWAPSVRRLVLDKCTGAVALFRDGAGQDVSGGLLSIEYAGGPDLQGWPPTEFAVLISVLPFRLPDTSV